jgi:hypothetical protein
MKHGPDALTAVAEARKTRRRLGPAHSGAYNPSCRQRSTCSLRP